MRLRHIDIIIFTYWLLDILARTEGGAMPS